MARFTEPRPPVWALLAWAAALPAAGCTSNQVWFSDVDDIEAVIAGELEAANTYAHVAAYTFTSEPIRDALLNAHYRGVEVQVICDAEQYPINADIITSLDLAEIENRSVSGFSGGIMHHKFIVIDGERVLTGSYNFTLSANSLNDENLVLLADPRIAVRYEEAFQDIWGRE